MTASSLVRSRDTGRTARKQNQFHHWETRTAHHQHERQPPARKDLDGHEPQRALAQSKPRFTATTPAWHGANAPSTTRPTDITPAARPEPGTSPFRGEKRVDEENPVDSSE